MLNAIRRFFDQHVAAPADATAPPRALEIATAALLIEVVRLDGGITPGERAAVRRAVQSKFAIPDADAQALVDLAEAEAREATDHYQFTSLINRTFTAEQKARVMELLWAVALADATVSAHERHVLRKLADLLHIPHATYVAAMRRAHGDAPPD